MQSASLIETITQRHGQILSSVIGGSDKGWKGPREHHRWAELIDKCGDSRRRGSQTGEDGKSRSQATSSASASYSGSLGPAYVPAETTVRNDYSQHFIDTLGRTLPGSAVCNPSKARRFEEYPKLRRLVEMKSSLLDSISHPPFYLAEDLLPSLAPAVATGSSLSSAYTGLSSSPSPEKEKDHFHLSRLVPIKFDVVIIDPPLESYEWESMPSSGKRAKQVWSWDQVAALPIPQLMAKESFIFLWVGSGASDGLERGREVLMRWGYRRCEDIVWVQNNADETDGKDADDDHHSTAASSTSSTCLAKTAQHCLMGIRGTVRRTSDGRFVHCNIDTDVILWPGETADSSLSRGGSYIDTRCKPPELMNIAENFCLGTRRLELFGTNRNLRRGWLTIGTDVGPQAAGWQEASQGLNACAVASGGGIIQAQPYDKPSYDSYFGVDRAGCTLAERSNIVPYVDEIDLLRPKSPSSSASGLRRSTAMMGRGAGGPASQRQQQHYTTDFPNQKIVSPSMHYDSSPYNLAVSSSHHHVGGAGISGLGAGGPSVVSVPSGSEMLSGAQATVLKGQTNRPP